jgi:hypothetical protein
LRGTFGFAGLLDEFPSQFSGNLERTLKRKSFLPKMDGKVEHSIPLIVLKMETDLNVSRRREGSELPTFKRINPGTLTPLIRSHDAILFFE